MARPAVNQLGLNMQGGIGLCTATYHVSPSHICGLLWAQELAMLLLRSKSYSMLAQGASRRRSQVAEVLPDTPLVIEVFTRQVGYFFAILERFSANGTSVVKDSFLCKRCMLALKLSDLEL